MKCLRINSGKGEFSLDGATFLPLDEIKKDDVLRLLDVALDPGQGLEMDEYSVNSITNQAHKVIYENLYRKFTELINNRGRFISEVNELYQEAYDKYKPQEIAGDSDN